MNIAIIGSGYVGLVTGACLANMGHSVTCLDNNKKVISSLRKSKIPFYEPGLSDLVSKNIANKNLFFTSSYAKGCKSDLLFLCIDTPPTKDGAANMTNFYEALHSILKNVKKNILLITKSTAPIGTTAFVQSFFSRKLRNKKINIDACANPEFLREGSAISDFQNPARIVVGSYSKKATKILKELYLPICKDKKKFLMMSPESAELTKYSSNAFLATKISFMNEIAKISEVVDANIHDVSAGMSLDTRIGKEFLNSGLGFGGSCFPKDLSALIKFQEENNIPSGVLKGAKKVNDKQVNNFAKKILKFIGKNSSSLSITVWGLSFKPNTDDLRESLSLKLIRILAPHVKLIQAYDPVAMNKAKKELEDIPNICYLDSQYQGIDQSSILIICTEWDHFLSPKIEKIMQLKLKIIFDGRNILDKASLTSVGIKYHGIGLK